MRADNGAGGAIICTSHIMIPHIPGYAQRTALITITPDSLFFCDAYALSWAKFDIMRPLAAKAKGRRAWQAPTRTDVIERAAGMGLRVTEGVSSALASARPTPARLASVLRPRSIALARSASASTARPLRWQKRQRKANSRVCPRSVSSMPTPARQFWKTAAAAPSSAT